MKRYSIRHVYCLLVLVSTTMAIEVWVDPVNGNDSSCSTYNNSISSQPCKTLQHALGNVDCNCRNITETSAISMENIVIKLMDGIHIVQDCIGITFGRNVTIEAENSQNAIIRCGRFPSRQRFDTGLVSCNTVGLVFRGIVLEQCGPHTPNVFINRSTNVLFEDCLLRGNTGAPLQLQFVPSITLLHTSFVDNFNQAPAEVDNSNTTISELFDSITTAGAFTYFSRNNSVNIVIENCTFTNNSAGFNDVNNSRPVLLKANGHGGGVLIRLAQVQGASITISNSTFSDNQAEVDGGGVYFSLSEEFSSSNVNLLNNRFIDNRVSESSGGAVSLNLFRFSFNNSFQVRDCTFQNNGANAGGVFSIALYDTGTESIANPDSALFERCTFSSNWASNEGTAVGLFALVHVDEVGFLVTFSDCRFENNTSIESTAEHSSSLVAFRFPTRFKGQNYFIGNRGGGITLLNTILKASGTILFDSNSALFGGGISMDDRCLVEVRPNVNLTFINNTAEETGGAIHVTFPAIRYTTDIFNRLCFIQYSDPEGRDIPPHRWQNVTVSFYNNTARLSGAAVYASDMQLCHWLGPVYTSDNSIIFNYPEDSNVASPFYYQGNFLLNSGQKDERLATSPHRVHIISEYLFVQPGESVALNLLATDQLNNNREAVFSLVGPHGTSTIDGLSSNNETFVYPVPAIQMLSGELSVCSSSHSSANGEFNLTFSLPGTSGLVQSVAFNFSGCHPGYSLDMATCMCMCDVANRDVVRCDRDKRNVYLRSGVWAGVSDEDDRRMITARVQPSFVLCQQDGQLPGCLFLFDNQDAQCTQGREGILCGQCSEGYAVTLDLLRCTLSQDQCAGGLSVFLILCAAVVIVCLLILIFNVELPNEMKGFVFYAQVIGLVYRPYIILQASSSTVNPLGVFLNLLGFSLPLPLCVSPSLRAHHVALLGYITPIIGVLIVVSFAVGARFIKILSNHSALKGITFLSIFIYKYIADTSFILISCSDTEYGFVFQYDGSLSCMSIEFGLFVLFGLALVLLFVAPAPFAVGYICTRRPQKFQQYADVLTKGLKSTRRWFGGWDIGRRLPFVFIGYLTVLARPSLVLFLMALVAVVVLLVHLLSKPYKRNFVNVIEALILLDLVAVTVVFLDPTDNPVPEWFSTTLLILPYLYAVLYLIWIVSEYCWRRYISQLKCGLFLSRHIQRWRSRVNNARTEIALQTGAGTQATADSAAQQDSARNSNNSTGSGDSDTISKSGARPTDTFEQSCSQLREPLLDTF